MHRFPVFAAAALILVALAAPAAQAGPSSPTTAVVSMGDSYISGEAGRWQGNSITPLGDHDGTDRACVPAGLACQPDPSTVYLGGSASGCHRSDVAEVLSASLPVGERVNISCSGAVTRNLFRASQGGEGQNGEPAQADQLLPIAQDKAVKLIVVSIGGNDLGFAGIVAACFEGYLSKQGPCEPAQQQAIDQKLAQATAGVEKAIDEIRAVMAQAGYRDADYRLVLQSYPSVIPRAPEARYPEAGAERTLYGCPFYDQDMTWARDHAAPQIGAMVKAAAAARGVEALDLIDALQGHEICSTSTAEATPIAQPPAAGSEWGRFVGASTIQQGDLQEAFHPNAFAQRALGSCLTQVYAQAPGRFTCAGAAGRDTAAMTVTRVGDVAAPQRIRRHRTRGRRGRTPL